MRRTYLMTGRVISRNGESMTTRSMLIPRFCHSSCSASVSLSSIFTVMASQHVRAAGLGEGQRPQGRPVQLAHQDDARITRLGSVGGPGSGTSSRATRS